MGVWGRAGLIAKVVVLVVDPENTWKLWVELAAHCASLVLLVTPNSTQAMRFVCLVRLDRTKW
jgi:hypothetical protein